MKEGQGQWLGWSKAAEQTHPPTLHCASISVRHHHYYPPPNPPQSTFRRAAIIIRIDYVVSVYICGKRELLYCHAALVEEEKTARFDAGRDSRCKKKLGASRCFGGLQLSICLSIYRDRLEKERGFYELLLLLRPRALPSSRSLSSGGDPDAVRTLPATIGPCGALRPLENAATATIRAVQASIPKASYVVGQLAPMCSMYYTRG